jgi:predicted HicB family RNase H-like nuclease
MPQKSPQKGARPQVKKVMLELPEELHYALKLKATEERTTIRSFITDLIQQAVKKGGEKKR